MPIVRPKEIVVADVERLEAELALAKALEPLEEAREAMHADNNPKTVAAYRKASEKVVALRQELRTKYPTAPGAEGNGIANPDTVKATGKAVGPR